MNGWHMAWHCSRWFSFALPDDMHRRQEEGRGSDESSPASVVIFEMSKKRKSATWIGLAGERIPYKYIQMDNKHEAALYVWVGLSWVGVDGDVSLYSNF
jgi:hypothetical protein